MAGCLHNWNIFTNLRNHRGFLTSIYCKGGRCMEDQRRWLVLVEAARGSVANIASVQLVFEPPQE